jgi:hypothetical protein
VLIRVQRKQKDRAEREEIFKLQRAKEAELEELRVEERYLHLSQFVATTAKVPPAPPVPLCS